MLLPFYNKTLPRFDTWLSYFMKNIAKEAKLASASRLQNVRSVNLDIISQVSILSTPLHLYLQMYVLLLW